MKCTAKREFVVSIELDFADRSCLKRASEIIHSINNLIFDETKNVQANIDDFISETMDIENFLYGLSENGDSMEKKIAKYINQNS